MPFDDKGLSQLSQHEIQTNRYMFINLFIKHFSELLKPPKTLWKSLVIYNDFELLLLFVTKRICVLNFKLTISVVTTLKKHSV